MFRKAFLFRLIFSILFCSTVLAQKDNLLYAIKLEDKQGFINKNGEIVIKPQFLQCSYASHFAEGLAKICIGFIDKTGKLAIKNEFDYALSFENGLANVCEKSKKICGYINKKGIYIWKNQTDLK